MKRLALALGAAVLVVACADARPPTGPGPTPHPEPIGPDEVFVGAGDIAQCDAASRPHLTAALLDGIPGTVFTAGDNAYPDGSTRAFMTCYEPTWGRHKARTRPSPGNHDYDTPGAAPYFAYFGSNAGPPGLGYYSFTLGSWHIISLNSEISAFPGSAQMDWLRNDLAMNPTRCALAYFHTPVFSSGLHGDNPHMQAVWRVLYATGVDVIVNGHDHNYERFAPMDPDGERDLVSGIRQFVVGTGGGPLQG
ncbi:MAG: metallophosphoesterase, partial [Acidobacteria bacterium]|nr:metallophosphoesterase [Acidobacteriota bacterium]